MRGAAPLTGPANEDKEARLARPQLGGRELDALQALERDGIELVQARLGRHVGRHGDNEVPDLSLLYCPRESKTADFRGPLAVGVRTNLRHRISPHRALQRRH